MKLKFLKKIPCSNQITYRYQANVFQYRSISLIMEPYRSAHLKAMEVLKEAWELLSYDPNLRLPLWPSPEEARKKIMSIRDKVEIIKVGDNKLECLTGSDKIDDETAMSQCHLNLKLLLVTLGDKGCNCCTKMLKAHEGAEVDIIDRLLMPFGLLRSGVAPDHHETKKTCNRLSSNNSPRLRIMNGAHSLGMSLLDPPFLYESFVKSTMWLYLLMVLKVSVFGIPGEELKGVHSAREFVWWYNGHPDFSKFTPDLQSTDTAILLGQGNVALDVARILLRPPKELATTDIATHALEALRESSIRKVYLVGRRGPVQAACTAKELREILAIQDLHINIKEAALLKTSADEEE